MIYIICNINHIKKLQISNIAIVHLQFDVFEENNSLLINNHQLCQLDLIIKPLQIYNEVQSPYVTIITYGFFTLIKHKKKQVVRH